MESLLLALVFPALGALVGLGAAYVVCTYFPPEGSCGPVGAVLVTGGFIIGLAIEYLPWRSKQ